MKAAQAKLLSHCHLPGLEPTRLGTERIALGVDHGAFRKADRRRRMEEGGLAAALRGADEAAREALLKPIAVSRE